MLKAENNMNTFSFHTFMIIAGEWLPVLAYTEPFYLAANFIYLPTP
jgi:hypothetical protein